MAHRTRTHELHLVELPTGPRPAAPDRIEPHELGRLRALPTHGRIDHRADRHHARAILHELERGANPEELPDPAS